MMTTSWRAVRHVLVGGLAAAMVAGPLMGQGLNTPEGCRCVDRNGNPIPDCTCFQTPSPHRLLAMVTALRPERVHIGIMVNPDQERVYDEKGARVEDVVPDGPAAKAGIRAGDIITEVGGKSLLKPLAAHQEKDLDPNRSAPVQRLLAIARDLKPGTHVQVRFLRDGASHTVTVKTADMPGPIALSLSSGDSALRRQMWGLSDSLRILAHELGRYRFQVPDTGMGLRIWSDSAGHGGLIWAPDSTMRVLRLRTGLQVRDRCPGDQGNGVAVFTDDCVGGLALVELNPGLSSYFHTDNGVLVTDVRKDSRLGLQPGDVILAIGAREATSPNQVRRILRSYDPDETITFHIERKGRAMKVSGHMGRD